MVRLDSIGNLNAYRRRREQRFEVSWICSPLLCSATHYHHSSRRFTRRHPRIISQMKANNYWILIFQVATYRFWNARSLFEDQMKQLDSYGADGRADWASPQLSMVLPHNFGLMMILDIFPWSWRVSLCYIWLESENPAKLNRIVRSEHLSWELILIWFCTPVHTSESFGILLGFCGVIFLLRDALDSLPETEVCPRPLYWVRACRVPSQGTIHWVPAVILFSFLWAIE